MQRAFCKKWGCWNMNKEGNVHIKNIEEIAKKIDDKWGEGESNKTLKFAADLVKKLAARLYLIDLRR